MSDAPYRYAACRVERVVDGDTVDLWINLGFSTFCKKRVRLMGMNAPESRTRDLEEKKRGLAAKARLVELLAGGKCDLDSHELGKYGRVLGIIYVGSKNINKEILKMEGVTEYYGGKR